MSLPKFKGKYLEPSAFSPGYFLKYCKWSKSSTKFVPPEGAILCYRGDLTDYILKNCKTTELKGFFGGRVYLLNETDNRVAVVGKFGFGAPAAVVILEELIAFGVKKFISIGTAGALQKNLKIGDLVICEKAIRDEGTSYHYLKPSRYAYASMEMVKKIKESLDRFKQGYTVGTSWTTDAPYRETVSEIKRYQKEGVLTVEMEASALFAVAQYRGVEMGAVFTISDSLANFKRPLKFGMGGVKEKLALLYESALDVLR